MERRFGLSHFRGDWFPRCGLQSNELFRRHDDRPGLSPIRNENHFDISSPQNVTWVLLQVDRANNLHHAPPEIEMSGIAARHSRVTSSTTLRTRKRLPQANW